MELAITDIWGSNGYVNINQDTWSVIWRFLAESTEGFNVCWRVNKHSNQVARSVLAVQLAVIKEANIMYRNSIVQLGPGVKESHEVFMGKLGSGNYTVKRLNDYFIISGFELPAGKYSWAWSVNKGMRWTAEFSYNYHMPACEWMNMMYSVVEFLGMEPPKIKVSKYCTCIECIHEENTDNRNVTPDIIGCRDIDDSYYITFRIDLRTVYTGRIQVGEDGTWSGPMGIVDSSGAAREFLDSQYSRKVNGNYHWLVQQWVEKIGGD